MPLWSRSLALWERVTEGLALLLETDGRLGGIGVADADELTDEVGMKGM